MAVSAARQFACEVLLAVEERSAFASDLLHGAGGRALAEADRRLATELVMGTLRWRAQLDFVIERTAERSSADIDQRALTALRLGVYQLRFLDRIPAMAAVHESVELAKLGQSRAAGFVNAVLRHISRAPIAALLATESDLGRRRTVEYSHPAWLLERWSRRFGPAGAAAIAENDNRVPPVALWLSPGLETTGRGSFEMPPAERASAAGNRSHDSERATARSASFAGTTRVRSGGSTSELAGVELEPSRCVRDALRVRAGDLTRTQAYRDGRVWIQDEGSQLIAHLVEPAADERILDACAAPGGKTALLHRLAPAAALWAMDAAPARVRLLTQRLRGLPVRIRLGDARKPLPIDLRFERILVDAPCSGTGTLARNPEIRWRLREADLARLGELQFALLDNLAKSVEPGGRLVYSVCSLEPEEGAEVAQRFLAAHPEFRQVPAATVLHSLHRSGLLLANGTDKFVEGEALQIVPGTMGSDGFYAAIFARARASVGRRG